MLSCAICIVCCRHDTRKRQTQHSTHNHHSVDCTPVTPDIASTVLQYSSTKTTTQQKRTGRVCTRVLASTDWRATLWAGREDIDCIETIFYFHPSSHPPLHWAGLELGREQRRVPSLESLLQAVRVRFGSMPFGKKAAAPKQTEFTWPVYEQVRRQALETKGAGRVCAAHTTYTSTTTREARHSYLTPFHGRHQMWVRITRIANREHGRRRRFGRGCGGKR